MFRKYRIHTLIIGTLLVGLALFSCEDFADETYELSAIDAAAISAFEDTLVTNLAMKGATVLTDTSDNSLGIILAGGGQIDTTLMTVSAGGPTAAEVYTALSTVGITPFSANDSVFSTTIRADSLSYRLFQVSSAGTHVFYLKHYAAPNVYNSAGDMVAMESDDMSPELIAGLYDLPGPVPAIKGRYEYDLAAGTYLFEIARLEATVLDNFDIVFISE